MDLLGSSYTNECLCYNTLKSPLPLEALGLNAFNHPWAYQVSYLFTPTTLVLLVLSKFLTECATGQFRLLTLVAPCWMEAPWLPTVLNMLADIPHQCAIIRDIIMDVSVGQVLKGLQ